MDKHSFKIKADEVPDQDKATEPSEFEAELLFPANSYAEALERYTKMMEVGKPKENCRKAHECGKAGEYVLAIGYYTRAIHVNPEYVEAYFARAYCYSELGEHKKAVEDYSKAIELSPRFEDAFFNRGYVYQRLNEWKNSLADFDTAIDLNPRAFGAYINRGVTYENMGKIEKAIADYSLSIEIEPINIGAYEKRATLYFKLGENTELLGGSKYLKKAKQDLNKILEIDSKNFTAINNMEVINERLEFYRKLKAVKAKVMVTENKGHAM